MKSAYVATIFLFTMVQVSAVPQKIVVLSVPKSGTHLLGKAVELITGKKPAYDPKRINWDTHFYMAHETRLLPRRIDATYLVIFRDPRDQFVSLVRALENNNLRVSKDVSLEEIMRDMLISFDIALKVHYGQRTTRQNIKTLAQYYTQFLRFADLRKSYVTRFEKLVGEQGGGSDELQLHELRNIAAHVQVSLTDEDFNWIAANLFGDTHTFLQGQIGTWQSYLSTDNRILFNKSIGDILSRLGYTTDDTWIWT